MNGTCYEKLKGNALFDIVSESGGTISAEGFLSSADAFAAAMEDLGLRRGDVLAVYLPTCVQALTAFYACSKAGIAVCFAHPLTPVSKLERMLSVTGAKGVMCPGAAVRAVREHAGRRMILECGPEDAGAGEGSLSDAAGVFSFADLTNGYRGRTSPARGRGGDVAAIMHSGGTEGEPKLVMLSNDAVNAVADALGTFAHPDPGREYAIAALPVFHAYGLAASVHTCLVRSCNLVLQPKFSPEGIISEMKRRNVTTLIGTPAMFRKLYECPGFAGPHLKKLRRLWCGGDALSPEFASLFDALLERHGCGTVLMPGYGLTEVCGVAAANRDGCYKRGSCGKPVPGVRIEILDGNSEPLPPGETGEIAVLSPSVMEGYAGGGGITVRNGERWIRTGDEGYLDGEGFLFFTERRKRVVQINAMNVFPSEIERTAMSDPRVAEAAAVPYEEGGKTLFRLYVRLAEGSPSPGTEAGIRELCRENLMKYAVPEEIVFVSGIPRTALGKVDYGRLGRQNRTL